MAVTRESPTSLEQEASTEAVADQVFSAALGAFDVLNIYLGERLGLYRALTGAGALTPGEVATRSGIAERYAREWLEQQAASGLLTVLEPAGVGESRRFQLSDPAAEVLTDASSLSYLAPLVRFIAAAATQLPALAEAYRTGGGVSWAQFGRTRAPGRPT